MKSFFYLYLPLLFGFFTPVHAANTIKLLQGLHNSYNFVDSGLFSDSITDPEYAVNWISNFENKLGTANKKQLADYYIIKSTLVLEASKGNLHGVDFAKLFSNPINIEDEKKLFPDSIYRQLKTNTYFYLNLVADTSKIIAYVGLSITNLASVVSNINLMSYLLHSTFQDVIDGFFLHNQNQDLSPVKFSSFKYESLYEFLHALNSYHLALELYEGVKLNSNVNSTTKGKILEYTLQTKAYMLIRFHKLSIDLERLGLSGSSELSLIDSQLFLILNSNPNFALLINSLVENDRDNSMDKLFRFRKAANYRLYDNLIVIKKFFQDQIIKGVSLEKITAPYIVHSLIQMNYPSASDFLRDPDQAHEKFIAIGAIPAEIDNSTINMLNALFNIEFPNLINKFRSSRECIQFLK